MRVKLKVLRRTLTEMPATIACQSTKARHTSKDLSVRAAGKFYTPPFIYQHLVDVLIRNLKFKKVSAIRLIDPFCGDGRLLTAFIHRAGELGMGAGIPWHVSLWDSDPTAVECARKTVLDVTKHLGFKVAVDARCHDSFTEAQPRYESYDCVVTNPPWETLKPDRRELEHLSQRARDKYISALRDYDKRLAAILPTSQPIKKFSGWGTNLSRCGTEVAVRLTKPGGLCGIVAPAALLSDQMSSKLRKWLWVHISVLEIVHYPAETRLFEHVDQPAITIVARATKGATMAPMVMKYGRECRVISRHRLSLSVEELREIDYRLPVDFGQALLRLLGRWRGLRKVTDLESDGQSRLWLGRELDETNYTAYLSEEGRIRFLKGRMVGRFQIIEEPSKFVREDRRDIPESASHARIAWRDVSRRNQARRMHAALIPRGMVTGNSLHVAYFRDDDQERLRALLGVMHSIPFEYQVRSMLGTGHISLGVVRQVRIPDLDNRAFVRLLSRLVSKLERGEKNAELELEVAIAKAYSLTRDDLVEMLHEFDKVGGSFKKELVEHSAWGDNGKTTLDRNHDAVRIANHFSANLSELDLEVAASVPPGGNWKDVPVTVRSKRLEQIRRSYAAGEGSRSTYYGRLHPDRPSYTINTYFNRPGNGCHLHYDYEGRQHRVISEREAARLQSFPDSFVFHGSHASIGKQIGNAVPPLLAYQVAKALPGPGLFVDLFSGAGGLSLGFKWAGWIPIVANDIEASFLETYAANVHHEVICGDIRQPKTFDALVKRVKESRSRCGEMPLIVLGGPPCQGFSTAGNRRSIDDKRNKLFQNYKTVLETLNPVGFLFENVPGLTNMEGGRVFELVKRELEDYMKPVTVWKLKSEQYAVPQRRTRIMILAYSSRSRIEPPAPVTTDSNDVLLFPELSPAVTAEQALADLPPLKHGEDGSRKDYLSEPMHPYQELMRGRISPQHYLELIKASTPALVAA